MTKTEFPYPQYLIEKAQTLRHRHILVTGAHGFIGSHLLNILTLADVPCRGLSSGKNTSNVRLTEKAKEHLVLCDLDLHDSVRAHFEGITSVIHTATFGAYSWQNESAEIFKQVTQLENLLNLAKEAQVQCFIHLGSSSEYGSHCDQAKEDQQPQCNSLYSLAKSQCHGLISYYGKQLHFPAFTLRLFSIYGPGEHPQRLIPQICQSLIQESPVKLSDANTARDFVHIYDLLEIILISLSDVDTQDYGEAYNVCSGSQTTLGEIENLLKNEFHFSQVQWDTALGKSWDLKRWSGSTEKTFKRFAWKPQLTLQEGLRRTVEFYRSNPHLLERKLFLPKKKISIVAPCYMDKESIPVLFERLHRVFLHLDYDFEFIVIDDLSPDGAYEAFKEYALKDARWVLAKHTRNFGSQAIFLHGLELATGDAVILMDGDLQDPPELIPEFIKHWELGSQLCLGQRVSREEGLLFSLKCKAFYRLWNLFSRVEIPLDCGDFGLVSKEVVLQIIHHRARVKIWRALRAYPSYKTTLVPYQRPCRAFGHSTNSNRKLLLWFIKFVFSTPNYIALTYAILGLVGMVLFQGHFYFVVLWGLGGLSLLIALLNLIYTSYFNYPAFTTEELIKKQLLVRFPREDDVRH